MCSFEAERGHQFQKVGPQGKNLVKGRFRLIPNEGLLKFRKTKDKDGFEPDFSGSTKASFAHYQLKFETTPGRAIYEV